MTNSQEINNEQIKRIFEQKIEGKKDVFFLISIGSLGDYKLSPIHNVSEEYSGNEKFFLMLEEAFEENPYYIGIALYKKAVSKISKKPFYFKKIALKDDKNTGFNGLGGLDNFGGLEGVLEAKINTKYLVSENESLKMQIEKLEKSNDNYKNKAEKHKENKHKLEEEIRLKDWNLKTLIEDHKRNFDNFENDHKRELDNIERNNGRFEKVLTIGGLVAAKAAGLDESDLRGLLDMDDETKSIENKKPLDDSDIDIEEVEEFSGKKAEAKAMVDTINAFFIETIKSNSEQEAFNIIASFLNIINYAKKDFTNLKNLHNLVLNNFQNTSTQSAADIIIEKAENYNK